MMDLVSQQRFDAIVAKRPNEITVEEAGFLFARRDYLTAEQAERFSEVIAQPVVASPLDDDNDNEKLDRNALMKEAKALGITLKRDYTAIQVKTLIADFKMSQEAELEDERLKAEEKKKAEEAATAAEAAKKSGHKGNFDSNSGDQSNQ